MTRAIRKSAEPRADIASFHRELHRWYAQRGRRNLPWRNTDDAYSIYISEIMLQQTQVKTVLERYYFPFLERFPTLQALAAAKQDEVLSAWQGLGYYNRAINLQKAAQQCGGTLPSDVDELMKLSGIGRNTAHALAAFAFRKPVAVMEANVRRILMRVFALTEASEDTLWQHAGELLDTNQPFDYNQAMMDIGATVCTRRAPRCGECPLASICLGKTSPESYPAAKARKAVKIRRKHIIVFRNGKGEYYAAPRESRFLNGLYHFVEADHAEPSVTFKGHIYKVKDGTHIGSVSQQYSHFTLEADVRLMDAGTSRGKHWHTAENLRQLPVSMAEKKILALLPGS